jgi:hypothetical protein
LNAAIVHADVTRSYEEYLEILGAFYADDVEGSSETKEELIRGKARTPIPGDVVDETHSAWTLELVGVSGKSAL